MKIEIIISTYYRNLLVNNCGYLISLKIGILCIFHAPIISNCTVTGVQLRSLWGGLQGQGSGRGRWRLWRSCIVCLGNNYLPVFFIQKRILAVDLGVYLLHSCQHIGSIARRQDMIARHRDSAADPNTIAKGRPLYSQTCPYYHYSLPLSSYCFLLTISSFIDHT